MDAMAYYFLFLLLTATVVLAPWLGKDSRDLDPNHFRATHPLHPDAGMNCN